MFSLHIYISYFRIHLCSIWLLWQNIPWQKWVNREKIQLNRTYPFQTIYSKFSAGKRKLKHFSCSSIIRQYNLHSWEFVIKAQLDSSKTLGLWILFDQNIDLLAYHALHYAIYQFIHKKILAYGFLTFHTVLRKIKPNERRKSFWQQSNKTCWFMVLLNRVI